MKMCRWALAMVCLVAFAQGQSGLIIGSALDPNRVPIPAVKVYLQSADHKELQSVQTDSKGIYRFSVPDGSYTVRVTSDGKGEASAGPFLVKHDRVTTVDLVLKQPQFFDEPQFTVAGVTDNTYRGGHGSDTVLRSAEALTKATASLGSTSRDANAAEPHHALGEKDERAGRPLEAVQEFQRAAELNPSEVNLFDWGTELLSHRAPQAAAEVFAKGIRFFPQSGRMLLGVATAWYAAGSYEQAREYFFKAADLDPSDPKPYLFLGKVQAREITESAGYEERLARFARLQPSNALANYYYAMVIWNRHRGQDNPDASARVRALLERALALDPTLGPAYLQLGIVFASEAHYPEAIHAYQKAAEVSPELEETHYRLSEAYRITGDKVSAEREISLYNNLSQRSAEKVERERREIQQFVIALRTQKPQ